MYCEEGENSKKTLNNVRARSSLTFRLVIKRGFTLKLERDMIIKYSQMHRTGKY